MYPDDCQTVTIMSAQMDIPDPEKLWCGFLEVRESTGKAPK